MADETKTKPETKTKSTIDVKALADVANRVSLDSVTLKDLRASRVGSVDDTKGLVLGFTYRTAWKREDKRPGFDVTFELDARLEQSGSEGEQAVRLIDASLVLVLSYELPEV